MPLNFIPDGPYPAVSISNIADQIRFGHKTEEQGNWAKAWIRERLNLNGPLGIINLKPEGLIFETYLASPQPLLPIQTISPLKTFFSDYFFLKKISKLKSATVAPRSFSDICLCRGGHSLSPGELKLLLKFAENALKVHGNLLFVFSHFIDCDSTTRKTLKESPLLIEKRKQLFNDCITRDLFKKFAPKLELKNEVGAHIISSFSRETDRMIIQYPGVIYQKLKKIFDTNFPSDQQHLLKVSEHSKTIMIAVWLQKISA